MDDKQAIETCKVMRGNLAQQIKEVYYSPDEKRQWREKLAALDHLINAYPEIEELRKEVERLKEWQLKVEDDEAGCCPEDVGFVEYIAHLQAEVRRLTEQNRKLVEAVEHYADESKWKVAMLAPGAWTVAKLKFNDSRNGYEVAQAALAAIEGGEK